MTLQVRSTEYNYNKVKIMIFVATAALKMNFLKSNNKVIYIVCNY